MNARYVRPMALDWKDGRLQQGVTLLELMITVAIIGILAAIAYPSYQTQVVKTYRASAKSCVSEHAQFMERYYTTNMTYVAADPNLACNADNDLDERYTIAVGGLARGTFTVTATPVGAQLARDTQCGTLTLNQAGTRTISGSGSVEECW